MVAGGGIVGLACAERLLRAGVSTTVIAPPTGNLSAAWGSAGHLAVEQVEPFASRKFMLKALRQLFSRTGAIRTPLGEISCWLPFFLRLAAASGNARFRAGTVALASCMHRALPAWRATLDQIGHPEYLVERGHFIVWESLDTARRGKASWRSADTGPARFRDATREEFDRLQAMTAKKIHGAIRFDETGQFTNPGDLLTSLEQAVVRSGGTRLAGSVTRIVCDDGRKAKVETHDGMQLEADAVVVAAGVDSGRLLAATGFRVPIISERGYHVQAPADGWPEGMPPVVFEDRSMIVTNFTSETSSELRASGFVEFARAARPPEQSPWKILQEHIGALGLPFGRPLTRWMGARPTLPDYLPAIGKSPFASNLYYAFGHQHLGLTLAAVTAELITDLIAGERPAVDLRPFDLRRFGKP